MDLNQGLLFLHFLGLTLGFAVSFSNMVMDGLMAKASPADKSVLARFPPLMSRLGTVGLALLWVTGGVLLYTKWGGLGLMPWQFHVKLAAVVLLTITVTYIHVLEGRLLKGDQAAAGPIQTLGKMAGLFAFIALLFAVLTFD